MTSAPETASPPTSALRFVSFLETAAEGEVYAGLLPRAGVEPHEVRFLALTHDARRWLEEHRWPHRCVWDDVDESAVKFPAWKAADELVGQWQQQDCWPEPFARRCVSPEFWRLFYHAIACERLLAGLDTVLQGRTLLMLPVEGQPLASFRLENVGANDVFRAVLQGYARHRGLASLVLRPAWLVRVRNRTRAVRYVLRHVVEDLWDRYRQGPELEELACSQPAVAPVDVLIANWRGDMERTFRMPALLPHLAAVGLSGAHLVWAPHHQHLPTRAPVGHAVYRAGLRIPPIGAYVRAVAVPSVRAYWALKRRMPAFLAAGGYFAVAGADLGFEYLHLAFHGTRETALARRLIRVALGRFQPRVLVSSDVNLCSFHAILEEARQRGVTTVTVNHSYYLCNSSAATYRDLADVCTAGGPSAARHMNSDGGPCARIEVTGNAVLGETPDPEHERLEPRKRIAIVTTSFFGLWSSLSSVGTDGVGGVERLAQLAASGGDWDVVIKSHPVADFHVLYDAVVQRAGLPNLTHVRTGWQMSDFAQCDVVVIWGGMTGSILQAQQAGVPLIYLADLMAEPFRRELGFEYPACGFVVASPEQAMVAIRRLFEDGGFRAQVLEQGRRYLDEARGDWAKAMPTFAALLARLSRGER